MDPNSLVESNDTEETDKVDLWMIVTLSLALIMSLMCNIGLAYALCKLMRRLESLLPVGVADIGLVSSEDAASGG